MARQTTPLKKNPFLYIPGFFNIWGFGRTSKQANHPAKKAPECATIFSLDLTGDLIGHSAAVQVCWI